MNIKLNRNQLKYIAIIAMIIDHIALHFIPMNTIIYTIFRTIGKLTAPIMCYFLVEGYKHTSSKKKYGMRLLIFAIISQLTYSVAHFYTLFIFNFNMIFTLFICFTILWSYDKIKNVWLKCILILFLTCISYFCDWGIFAPLWVFVFYVFDTKTLLQIISYCIIVGMVIIKYVALCENGEFGWNIALCQLGLFLFLPILYLYNGKNGNNNGFNKWFFYIFYPLHFLIIILIKIIMWT